MDIGILKETYANESRVILNPAGVAALTEKGHRVYVENSAGANAGWQDTEYMKKGAIITYSKEETISRSELILKVLPPSKEEASLFETGQTLVSFLLAAAMPKEIASILNEKKITAIALESISTDNNEYPFRQGMSEIAGHLAIHFAAMYLLNIHGGRGLLLNSLPTVPGAQVTILGAGAAGVSAARAAIRAGARVILLDRYPSRLRNLPDEFHSELETMVAIPDNITRVVAFADVLISAVHLEDARAPHVLTVQQIQSMKPGSVFIDLAIDQGGSSETSRPTTLQNPVYIKEGVTHICVPNLPSAVGRMASHLLTNLLGDTVLEIAEQGLELALSKNEELRRGVTIYKGKATRKAVADYTGLPFEIYP
ncbi:MAG: alanine dehydrogenase [bacterium]|nr:alanine dehydrogenase [bacterium]